MRHFREERGWVPLLAAAMAAATFAVVPLDAQNGGAAKNADRGTAAKAAQNDIEDPGQRVFAQHCSRCHNAPEGFSPRISGTVARHMRMRANLSENDYKALLHFLNP